jgi:hypothetical protein
MTKLTDYLKEVTHAVEHSDRVNETAMSAAERQLEEQLIASLTGLKYTFRPDISDRAALEKNFRAKFEGLNQIQLTNTEFCRLLEEIVTPDVFTAAKTLRSINSFTRDDGTPLNFTLVNIKEWCKNSFEVVSQLRINTDYSHHRYDVMLLINGVPVVQIELKTLGINPRRAMEQIVEYKNDPGNGYARTLLCFVQLFIVSIPVCILVLKRCKKPEDVLFINASGPENFSKGKRQNYMTDEHIERIIKTYRERPEKPIERYARRVSMKEIEGNDYNLNITLYVSTAQEEKEIVLADNHKKLVEIESEIQRATDTHNVFLRELGLPELPLGAPDSTPPRSPAKKSR